MQYSIPPFAVRAADQKIGDHCCTRWCRIHQNRMEGCDEQVNVRSSESMRIIPRHAVKEAVWISLGLAKKVQRRMRAGTGGIMYNV
jgi:hypothetical protein